MNTEKEGQISAEYLIVVGFIIFILIGILVTSLFYSNLISNNIKISQVGNFANKIISSAEKVFYSGEPSLATITVYLPSGVQGISISGKEIVLNVSTTNGINRISYSSKVPINGVITKTEGVKKIKIVAFAGNVSINEVS